MLDINFVRENVTAVRNNLTKRNNPELLDLLDELLKLDEIWRKAKGEADNARKVSNAANEELNQAVKAMKAGNKDVKIEVFKETARKAKQRVSEKEAEETNFPEQIRSLLMRIPNMMDKDVPVGKDDSENVVVKTVGKKPKFDFTPISHVDIVEKQGWVDLDRAAKISGARWYFLKGELALLELAITKYAVDFMTQRGFTFIVPPFMMRRHAYEGVVSLSEFEDVMYKVEGKIKDEEDEEDLYAIATSEHPLTAMYMNEVLDLKQLPIKLVGYSTNFRKEAGSHGKDQKGIFRVHQFNKIEQIVLCSPEDSWEFHEEILKNAMGFFESLGLHFQVVNVCTGDLGIIAAKKYDIETWYPVQNAFREVVSCSNCTTYQSVRANIKFQYKQGRSFVHTLNSTCVATSRALVAIMENFQNEDGTVNVPEVLQKYVGFKVMGKPIK
ncbi:serine--tRNA ligase [Candidatus Woesearchaeota archaeon CG10_big_fil_rev_8_21_14_0_10_37_12]|nr:MAG: serine--tRNA ligase [Candidatus Woesearchaeota archaeon CG10_big_fil_rev_8_21_14_0_10_37_12]